MTKREKFLLVFLFLLLAGAAYVLLFFMPTSTRTAELQESVASLEIAVSESRTMSIQYATFSQALADLDAHFEESLQGVPYIFDDIQVQKDFHRIIASRAGNLTLEYGEPIVREGGIYVAAVTATFTAEMGELMAILWELRLLPYTSRIIEYSASARGGNSYEFTLTIEFPLRTGERVFEHGD
jgi:hypothetical protein